jgi:hypothetical protein
LGKKKAKEKKYHLDPTNISLIKNNHVSSFQITIFMTVFWKKSMILEGNNEMKYSPIEI